MDEIKLKELLDCLHVLIMFDGFYIINDGDQDEADEVWNNMIDAYNDFDYSDKKEIENV